MYRMFALWIVLSTGCADLLVPRLPDGAVRFTPPVMVVNSYEWMWRRMERCSGITGDFSRVEWFYYPDAETFPVDGRDRWGWWQSAHRVYLAGNHREGDWTPPHEMLHDLLQTGEHPSEYFIEKCGYELNIPGAKNRFPGQDIPQNVPYP